jgi:NAD(P)H-dependent flavin oxidoreductase YrpB (nitropropane dioxygenase family)
MSFTLNSIMLSGMEVLPIIEGGKGISISSGTSSGAFGAANCVGTFSGVNSQRYFEDGTPKPVEYKGKTRLERHEELVQMGIEGGIQQAEIAYEIAAGRGPIHMNILWEMGGAQRVLEGILDGARGLIQGITCGAGMPYRLGEIAAQYQVYYYPIVSSMRAFRALWKRSYSKFKDYLGGVVYEDPWRAGGHNGLSNSEDPNVPQDPYPRVAELRAFMNEVDLHDVPIIMAGGVWNLAEWEHWLDNKEIGKIAFQFGTRPIVTEESPVPLSWKRKLLTLKEGDVFLNQFSPTGFYSSAVNNDFIKELRARSERQVKYSDEADADANLITQIKIGQRGRSVYVDAQDVERVSGWVAQGYTEALRTPDSTLVFVAPEKAQEIHRDQVNCMGCLSVCRFSNWTDKEEHTTHKKPDPRSFCIQKTLQDVVDTGDVENNLMFSGHNAYRFATDPFYNDGFIPTVKQLVERIASGL